jgi:hypothetical protein
MNDQIKKMRARIVEFVKSNGGQADRRAIKEHLGLDPLVHWECFDRAVKTKKLEPVYGSGHVGSGLFLRVKPVVAYKLT